MWRILLALVMAVAVMGLPGAVAGAEKTRDQLHKEMENGNYKVAYDGLSKLVMDKTESGEKLARDFAVCVQALRNLGRTDEVDDFIEKAVATHGKDPLLLMGAATSFYNIEHYGAIIAGKYYRGGHRGGTAKWVNTLLRDRVRQLQLLRQAMENVGEADKALAANVYHAMADALVTGFNGREAWRLGGLTDIATLPDYEEGYGYQWYRNGGKGAPVNEDGTPMFHANPKSWETARTDGERWRWCMTQAAEMGGASMAQRVRYEWATFLHEQFGVQTMAYAGWWGRQADDEKKNEAGPMEVSTLGEDETIARLATGIKRFKVPDEYNYIRVCQQILSAEGKPAFGDQASDLLAQTWEDRQQYPKAAEQWRSGIARFGPGPYKHRQQRLEQVIGNWGAFETTEMKAAAQDVGFMFRFRNGKKVTFTAQSVDVAKLLEDVKAFVRTKPNNLDWERMDIANIGQRLIDGNQKKYVGKEVATWDLALEPREKHFDRKIPVTTPAELRKAGAYLVTAKMEGGSTSYMVLWTADKALVKKPLDSGTFFYVADATSGKPVAGAKVDIFGYRHNHVKDNTYKTDIVETSAATDENGTVVVTNEKVPSDYQYLVTATTDGGGLAYIGFSWIWYGRYTDQYDEQYKRPRPFVITDRPVYRPGQTVKWKMWLNTAKYDREGKSEFAGQSLPVHIHDPKGQKLFELTKTADDFGGIAGEFTLEKSATLGVYQIFHPNWGGTQFRVEEYKKPEFEVTVDAPAEPVMLGDKITATINTKYYFGAPVVNAKVKYRITRTAHSAQWYPRAPWDWFYEPGYWWFAYDYVWYPGFSEWGCFRPHAWWVGWAGPQPEVVSEAEVPVGADGTVKVEIDTTMAKAMHGDEDHKYEITADVTDESRRTITGTGSVLVARKPFKVYAWVDRGYARVGDQIKAGFQAQTLDNKPVTGKGKLKLMKISYLRLAGVTGTATQAFGEPKPVENEVGAWDLDPNAEGQATQSVKAAEAGQYRLSYTVTDAKGHAIEGGYVFTVRENGLVANGKDFRFSDIELVPEKKEYKAGETVRLMINTNREDASVVLFVRPSNGVYLPPKIIAMKGKSMVEEIAVTKKDMPNFFVEAMVVYNARVFSDVKEIVVPPEDRVLNVAVEPSAKEYKPGAKARIKIKVTEKNGEPFNGSAVLTMYDKAVEYISGGSNVQDIRTFFWKWRRSHNSRQETSLSRNGWNLVRNGKEAMANLGAFGHLSFVGGGMFSGGAIGSDGGALFDKSSRSGMNDAMAAAEAAPAGAGGYFGAEKDANYSLKSKREEQKNQEGGGPSAGVEPTVRSNFADTALWVEAIETAKDGTAEVDVTMPENLTTWKTKVWTMGAGTRVGQGEAEVITTKNLIVRLQSPRFFVTTDEVVLSANVHNYLKTAKDVRVSIDVEGDCLLIEQDVMDGKGAAERLVMQTKEKAIHLEPKGEKRVDWRVRVAKPGTAVVRVKAITDEESDATQMSFPVYIHGMLKTDSFSGAMRGDESTAKISYKVPKERKTEQSRVEIRYSPSLAVAMVDALPYMVEYPYGCTEQTLNRFVPTVVTQKILQEMKVDLAAVKAKRVNLNAQEIGDPQVRAERWKRWNRNPVFDKNEVDNMVKEGVKSLTNMQLSDGGWGWFSGYSERSYPHTTAVVVHGLQIARANDVAVDDAVMKRGIDWLETYQLEQVQWLRNHDENKDNPEWRGPSKTHADALDALVHMVLEDGGKATVAMRDYLYRDRTHLPVYAKALFGLSLVKAGDKEKLDMILQNIAGFVQEDAENQSAYLKMPEDNYWWYWYGSDVEANAFYLKLLAKTDPKGKVASGLAKYLINNRKHATYWNSTRDSAYAIEALADYVRASGEASPDMTVEIAIDGKKIKEVKIDATNLFTFDGTALLTGDEVKDGAHEITFTKRGTGPLYFNAYVTNFTLEDRITKAGLEVKVNRKLYKLTPVDKKIKVEGAQGQALDQKVEKYQRTEVSDMGTLKSGDLCEIELEIDSKNDYEYILIEDMKAAGFEPVQVRSGYNGNDMGAYVEFRDERVCFFVRMLARGKHSVAYKLRAEIPGKFSALPTKANGMYAPELRANSDEIKVQVTD